MTKTKHFGCKNLMWLKWFDVVNADGMIQTLNAASSGLA